MILSQTDLRKAVEEGKIGFTPALEDKQWGEASIDLRLGFQFTKLQALDLAHEIVRHRRGVVRIDGGTIDGRPLPVK